MNLAFAERAGSQEQPGCEENQARQLTTTNIHNTQQHEAGQGIIEPCLDGQSHRHSMGLGPAVLPRVLTQCRGTWDW